MKKAKRLERAGDRLLFSAMAAVAGLLCGCAPRTPVVDAAANGDLGKVKQLLKEGHSINERDHWVQLGWTPLIAAIFQNQTNVVHYLIASGANVNVHDNTGETALMWAMLRGDEDLGIVKDLMAHGADLNAKDNMGATVLSYAEALPPRPRILEAVRAALARQQHK